MFKAIIKTLPVIFCVVFLTGCSGSGQDTEFGLREDAAAGYESADKGAEPLEDIADESDIHRDQTEELFVYVCGAVKTPGVYEFEEGTRIYEAINAAGGFEDGADQRVLNLAEPIRDGQQLYVPSFQETAGGGYSPENKASPDGDGLININTASAAELTAINGIGESRAGDIISYRERNGAFNDIEDIMKVPGIKKGLFNRIKDKITV